MEYFNSEAEKIFYDRVKSFWKERQLESKYSIVAEPILSLYTDIRTVANVRPDFLILKGAYPYIIVEISSLVFKDVDGTNYVQGADNMLDLIQADYFVLTDNENIIMIDRRLGITSRIRDFAKIYELFENELHDHELESLRRDIAGIISNVADGYRGTTSEEQILGPRVQAILKNEELTNNIAYNSEGRFFHFSTKDKPDFNDFEHRLFMVLLQPIKDNMICRYTTLDTIYHMVNNKSFRMGSNIAMNDRGEFDYVDKYIGIFYKPLHLLSLSEMQRHNRSYIASCTTSKKIDDLTMFRLYGDDSKGVCLCFEVATRVNTSRFLIRKISYGSDVNKHPELDLIKGIINAVKAKLKMTFRFLYLDIWKHFFKSHDYMLEEEVRLLYLENGHTSTPKADWVLTSSDKILSKCATFNLGKSGFPLKLTKIILGPNCPESQLNQKQFGVLADERGIKGLAVEISKIESYRKS